MNTVIEFRERLRSDEQYQHALKEGRLNEANDRIEEIKAEMAFEPFIYKG